MTAATPLLQASAVSFRYPNADKPTLNDFDLSLRPGEVVSVLGPSGVGKSSLLRMLGGLQQPSAGTVSIEGSPMRTPHPRVAIAFQNPALLPWLNLESNVAFGLDFRHQPTLSPADRAARIKRALEEVGLTDARHHRTSALSGGMAQRASLARCLARQPKILLLDEPFGALDEITRAEMQVLLLKVVRDFGTAVVLITHDLDEALLVSDRVILLGGTPAGEAGQWHVGIPHPRDDHVAELGQIRIEIVKALRHAQQRLN